MISFACTDRAGPLVALPLSCSGGQGLHICAGQGPGGHSSGGVNPHTRYLRGPSMRSPAALVVAAPPSTCPGQWPGPGALLSALSPAHSPRLCQVGTSPEPSCGTDSPWPFCLTWCLPSAAPSSAPSIPTPHPDPADPLGISASLTVAQGWFRCSWETSWQPGGTIPWGPGQGPKTCTLEECSRIKKISLLQGEVLPP